jgi:hypothetical protein
MPGLFDSILGTKKVLKDAANQGAPATPKVNTPAGIDVAAEAAKVASAKRDQELARIRKRQQLQNAAKKK